MISFSRFSNLGATLLVVTGALAAGAGAGAQFASPSPSGQSLLVPDDQASSGRVYHALTGADRQIHFSSTAPLETIKGQSNAVIGYAVAGPSGGPANLQGAEWHVPVASLRTGIELRDEHLRSRAWLDSESHPNIVFKLGRVDGITIVKESEAFRTFSATLVGQLTIHGVTRDIQIPAATISFLQAGPRTQKIGKGDLLAIRAKYSVSLGDYEVSHGLVGSKVAETVEIDTQLVLSTIPPEQQ